jgi:Ca2+-binding EF-hand superfamily protein
VDKTILEGSEDKSGKINYEEFKKMITNIDDIEEKMTISFSEGV